jgi:DNA-nicking Smr family endonuclease
MSPRPSDAEEQAGSPDPTGSEEFPLILPIEDSLDLHAFAPRDIPDVVRDYLEECARQGLAEIRLIHGRGTGTQRAIVRSILMEHPLVRAFADAPPERGGWGATIVRLREITPPK